MMEVVVTTGAIRCVKFQSKCHHQQTNIQFLQAGCPSCRPIKALKKNNHTFSIQFQYFLYKKNNVHQGVQAQSVKTLKE